MNRGLGAVEAARTEIDERALIANLRTLRSQVDAPMAAVVKANAYGHGLEIAASALIRGGAEMLAVSEVADAFALASAGYGHRTLLLSPAPADALAELRACDVTVTVSSLEGCRALSGLPGDIRPRAHLHLDTGMHRLGVEPKDIEEAGRILREGSVRLDGAFIHPARADAGDWPDVEREIAVFSNAVAHLSRAGLDIPVRHHGGSTLLIERPDLVGDLGRPGIALYGHHPSQRQRSQIELLPTLRLLARIVELREVPAGARIGYSDAGVFRTAGRIATIDIGASHGIDHRLAQGGQAIVRDHVVPFIGSVMLEFSMLDVTGTPAEVGDEVLVYGGRPDEPTSVQRVARLTGAIVDHVFCRLSSRLPRTLVGDRGMS